MGRTSAYSRGSGEVEYVLQRIDPAAPQKKGVIGNLRTAIRGNWIEFRAKHSIGIGSARVAAVATGNAPNPADAARNFLNALGKDMGVKNRHGTYVNRENAFEFLRDFANAANKAVNYDGISSVDEKREAYLTSMKAQWDSVFGSLQNAGELNARKLARLRASAIKLRDNADKVSIEGLPNPAMNILIRKAVLNHVIQECNDRLKAKDYPVKWGKRSSETLEHVKQVRRKALCGEKCEKLLEAIDSEDGTSVLRRLKELAKSYETIGDKAVHQAFAATVREFEGNLNGKLIVKLGYLGRAVEYSLREQNDWSEAKTIGRLLVILYSAYFHVYCLVAQIDPPEYPEIKLGPRHLERASSFISEIGKNADGLDPIELVRDLELCVPGLAAMRGVVDDDDADLDRSVRDSVSSKGKGREGSSVHGASETESESVEDNAITRVVKAAFEDPDTLWNAIENLADQVPRDGSNFDAAAGDLGRAFFKARSRNRAFENTISNLGNIGATLTDLATQKAAKTGQSEALTRAIHVGKTAEAVFLGFFNSSDIPDKLDRKHDALFLPDVESWGGEVGILLARYEGHDQPADFVMSAINAMVAGDWKSTYLQLGQLAKLSDEDLVPVFDAVAASMNAKYFERYLREVLYARELMARVQTRLHNREYPLGGEAAPEKSLRLAKMTDLLFVRICQKATEDVIELLEEVESVDGNDYYKYLGLYLKPEEVAFGLVNAGKRSDAESAREYLYIASRGDLRAIGAKVQEYLVDVNEDSKGSIGETFLDLVNDKDPNRTASFALLDSGLLDLVKAASDRRDAVEVPLPLRRDAIGTRPHALRDSLTT